MSLILEALRKSEAERRRGMAPDVAVELPPALPSRPRTLAAWLLPALVVAALLVLGGWWARHQPSQAAAPDVVIESTDPASAMTNPIPAGMPRIESEPAAPDLARGAAPELPAPLVQTPSPATGPPPTPSPTSPAVPAAGVPPERPAPLQSMPVQPALARRPPAGNISNDTSMLPPVKLSMHMWDEAPSRRFVILNGQRMAEGDRHGPISVIEIERNGVVVESNGTQARVPLP